MPDKFIHSFCKNADGSWTCTAQATLATPRGRIQVSAGSRFYPGTTFMDFDLAKWLQEQLDDRAGSCD